MATIITRYFLLLTFVALIACGTETSSPSLNQVKYAREFLYINPELDIDARGYVEKKGFDYHVRLKFKANPDDPRILFNHNEVNPDNFADKLNFPPPEASIAESWWDVYSQTVTGGNFWVPKSEQRF
jgi:hypothetical protein